MDMFSSEKEPEKIIFDLQDADVIYFPSFYTKEKADYYFQRLREKTCWKQDAITVYGKTYPQPRLTALYGKDNKPYRYSGITMQPEPFTPLLKEIKQDIEKDVSVEFTTVLLNLYRDGKDSNGWHSDDEKELGKNPVIASLSLGATRMFHLRHKEDPGLKTKIPLEHGSLLLMKGSTQHKWQHQLAKTAKETGPRINLTFRIIF